MPTIFPLSASVGQEYDGYIFDGTAWNLKGNEYNPTYYSATPPDNPKPGDLWVDSSVDIPESQLEGFLTEANASSIYLTIADAVDDYEKNIPLSASAPLNPENGDLWVDSSQASPIMKVWDTSEWKMLGSAPVPIITGIAPDNISGTASTAVIINGSNFESGAIAKIIDNSDNELFVLSTTFNNSKSIQILTPLLTASAGPYDIKITNPDNQYSILENALNVGQSPQWSTNAGSLGLVYDSQRSSTTFTLLAIDPDGQNISYQIASGNLPTGMSLTSGGIISGTAQAVASDTTYAFTIRATDTSNNYSDRSFSITVKAPVVTSFTTVGTTSWTSPVTANIRVLVVAGGGGGGQWDGGGGGAGGLIHNTSFSVSANQQYTVTVGSGGSGGVANFGNGQNGGNSIFGSLTAIGGGGGGGGYNGGISGGSGGGSSFNNNSATAVGGSGTVGQGYAGGNGPAQSGAHGGGGGGGAGAAGQNGTTSAAGNGGIGVLNDITGTPTYYAGGGGGSVEPGYSAANGGLGGGGNGFTYTRVNATPNTGGGGGGSAAANSPFPNLQGGDGGSGIVIIRY